MNTIITKEPMTYKTYLKNNETVTIRLRIVKHRIVDKLDIKDIAYRYTMHRNSVSNIMKLYNDLAPTELKQKLKNNESFSSVDIDSLCSFFLHKSRKPKTNPKQATLEEEKKVISHFEKLKIWAKRLHLTMQRKKELWDLTLPKIRWVYKRNWFKVQKVRTKNWETRSLYNYQTIWAFEHWHYDTKELADAKSLPPHIYENLKHNKHLPIYEWNIMFVWCRARFTAYSRWKTSTFWLQFLVLVLSHLRYCWIKSHIHMHTDWWPEFFRWSQKKQNYWNSILKELNSYIDCYNPNFDINKNLIERSHRSDDEEFLIPFWDKFKKTDDFMKQAQEYQDYWNNSRPHSWKWMNWKTPREKLVSDWIYQADKILDFKVLYLDAEFYKLQRHLEFFLFQKLVRNTNLEKLKTDRKISIDLISKYSHFKTYAQNVLTYYRKKSKKSLQIFFYW